MDIQNIKEILNEKDCREVSYELINPLTVEFNGGLTEDGCIIGTVQNVLDFGAFVDIGNHRTGLVHISEVADKFVKDIYSVVKVNDKVKVKVLEESPDGKIKLTMRV